MLKRLIFKQLLKIANIGKKRYTKSLQFRKFAVPLLSETGTKPDTESSLTILIAKTQAVAVLRFRFVCRFPYAI